MNLLSKLFSQATRAKEVIDESVAATQSLRDSLEKLDRTVTRYVEQEDCLHKPHNRRFTDRCAVVTIGPSGKTNAGDARPARSEE